MMEVVVTTGAINRAKLQSNHHHQQTPSFFTGQMPFLSPNQHWREKYHIPWTCLAQAHLGVFQLCFWPLTAPGYLGGGLLCLSSALWCQYSRCSEFLSSNQFGSDVLPDDSNESYGRQREMNAGSLGERPALTS